MICSRRQPMPRNDGYTLGAIAEEAGVSERTIRYGYERDLFVPPPFAGPGTRYLREHRLQILSIQKLCEQGLKLPEIKRKLATMSPADMEALLVPPPPAFRPPPAAAAGLVDRTPAGTSPRRSAASAPPRSATPCGGSARSAGAAPPPSPSPRPPRPRPPRSSRSSPGRSSPRRSEATRLWSAQRTR
ncbi:helix-turn-helix domain-containing protein [Sorangium sp. So ce362]|uniref:helix-turn-helix domain-containing protein n=1 Tax=Sorangium sp. So ce362 TaxID=3133303 RepID=UPI003F5F63D6